MKDWLELYPPDGASIAAKSQADASQQAMQSAAKRPVQATLDLHGKTAAEAMASLRLFMKQSFDAGLRKVLVVCGKGTHAKGQAVLPTLAKSYLEQNHWVVKIEPAPVRQGGAGAIVVHITGK